MRVAVLTGRSAVSSPPCVCNTSVGVESFLVVWLALRNELLQLRNLANLLVSRYFLLLVAINGQTRRIVASVFESRETCKKKKGQITVQKRHGFDRAKRVLTIKKSVEDEPAVPLDEVVDVAENSTADNLASHKQETPNDLKINVPHCFCRLEMKSEKTRAEKV